MRSFIKHLGATATGLSAIWTVARNQKNPQLPPPFLKTSPQKPFDSKEVDPFFKAWGGYNHT